VSAAALLLPSGEAAASGLSAARFGGEHGHPTADNPTAIYYNPAGIALKPGTRIFLDGNLAFRRASYDRPESAINDPGGGTPSDALDANAGTAKLACKTPSSAPSSAPAPIFGTKVFAAGAAAYFPFGGQAVWGQNTKYAGDSAYPGAIDGVQRWYTIDGKIRSMYLTGAMAFNIPQIGLSIGAHWQRDPQRDRHHPRPQRRRQRRPHRPHLQQPQRGPELAQGLWLAGRLQRRRDLELAPAPLDRLLLHQPAQRRRRHDLKGHPAQRPHHPGPRQQPHRAHPDLA
jgi:hypothetical protein